MKINRTSSERKSNFALTLALSAALFLLFTLILGIVYIGTDILMKEGVIAAVEPNIREIILYMLLASVALGTLLAFTLGRIPLRPLNRVIIAINRLGEGDFSVRLKPGSFLGRNPSVKGISESFNNAAAELQNTEMLREDFVNNFSHEFKTPIVSIAGFASLLRRGGLTPRQQEEYLAVIEEESLRLSAMATNVLSLTKVENQKILTGVTEYNLSEQLRACLLLNEVKWARKNLDVQPDFEEYAVRGNEKLLHQVWLNLIDNAVKFASAGGTVKINILPRAGGAVIEISDTGEPIREEDAKRIFSKFYQGDTSHSTEGNGVGLAIVKKVVELHKGTVSAQSADGTTTFRVYLPAVRFLG